MAKKNDLKNSMSAGLTGGLDSLIQSTAGQKAVSYTHLDVYKRQVIGTETGNRKGKSYSRPEWVLSIAEQAKAHGIPVFKMCIRDRYSIVQTSSASRPTISVIY